MQPKKVLRKTEAYWARIMEERIDFAARLQPIQKAGNVIFADQSSFQVWNHVPKTWMGQGENRVDCVRNTVSLSGKTAFGAIGLPLKEMTFMMADNMWGDSAGDVARAWRTEERTG